MQKKSRKGDIKITFPTPKNQPWTLTHTNDASLAADILTDFVSSRIDAETDTERWWLFFKAYPNIPADIKSELQTRGIHIDIQPEE